jgi:signal transduction histidine kinase
MDYNTSENLAACYAIVKEASQLLFYSHIPTAIIALIIGISVLLKDRKSLLNRLLFFITVAFSLWSFSDLALWLNYDKNTLLMFVWAFFGILYLLIYILSLYFVYVFIDKKDISFLKKIIIFFPLVPLIIFAPTRYNLGSYDIVNCIATEGTYYTNYYYVSGLVIFFTILIISLLRYRKAQEEQKKQILFLTLGIEFFLLSFFITGFLASYLIDNGYIAGGDYSMEQYGLFGMPIFLGFLGYLIVKFKAFNIKLIGAQALVAALIILIGSQFFFIQNNTNRILTGVTLTLALGFGWMLIKSIKMEVRRKEELQLMSDQLAKANDQLRKLDNAKSEFISIASHQLRTPLTAIKGFISLLLEGSYGKVEPAIKEVLNKVYVSNERLVELVEDMLNLSRIESGRMEYKFEKIKIPELLQEVYDTFMIRAKEQNLKMEMSIPEGEFPEVTTDRNKIREVISNLVDNALKYTKKGWVKVKLEKPESDKIRIAITDTGIGVPKEEIPYLFSKFSRGKDVNRLNTGGTGLGLHVGKRMIEALHGRIWVESQGANMGSTFFIEVPLEVTKEA